MKASTQSSCLQKLGRAGTTPPHSQRGVVMVLVTIAMAVLIGMSGLALDMGHAYLNKTRLQNALDAAALSGAKTLDQNPGDIVMAEAAAKDTFRRTAQGGGNQELDAGVEAGDITVQFYSTLVPLNADFANPNSLRFVRVSVNSFDKSTWFIHVLPGVSDTVTVGGSAMAGPSPVLGEVCNVAPMMVCADPDGGAGTIYGYTPGQEYTLVVPPPGQGGSSPVGPGNFQLIRLDNSKGGNDVRHNMAGSHEQCLTAGMNVGIDTETGQKTGPVYQGLNTRFGKYSGADLTPQEYPPDTNTCENISYSTYEGNPSCLADNAGSVDRYHGRRVIAVPIGDCSGSNTGQSTLPLVDFACFFLTREAGKGNNKGVNGEFLGTECSAKGTAGPIPVTGPGPHKIQLYQDPLSTES